MGHYNKASIIWLRQRTIAAVSKVNRGVDAETDGMIRDNADLAAVHGSDKLFNWKLMLWKMDWIYEMTFHIDCVIY